MFKSAIADLFYSEQNSFAADANSTLEQFSTPLKRLPDSSINDIRNDLYPPRTGLDPQRPGLDPQNAGSGASENSLRSRVYKLLSENGVSAPVSGSLEPLSELPVNFAHRTLQNELFRKREEPKADKAVFYKPLSIEGPVLPKSFIPQPLTLNARNPFIVAAPAPQNSLEDLDDLDDDEESVNLSPTGEWTSPVVIQALRRQVNKERIFKAVWHDALRWVFFHLALLFAAYFFRIYQLKFYDPNRLYRDDMWTNIQKVPAVRRTLEVAAVGKNYIHYFQWYFVVKIALGVVQLLWPSDQCTDLPLSNKQRELIGLKPINAGEDLEDAQADLAVKERLFESSQKQPIRVPKYRQLNDFPAYLRRDPMPQKDEDASIALSKTLPTARLIHSAPGRS